MALSVTYTALPCLIPKNRNRKKYKQVSISIKQYLFLNTTDTYEENKKQDK
jgi:hypothetical protein